MKLELSHEFDVPIDALCLAAVSPRLAEVMTGRLAGRVRIDQVEHRLEPAGKELRRRWVCRANAPLPPFARKHMKPSMLSWEEDRAHDLGRRSSEWVVTPHADPEWKRYFSARGSSVFEELGEGRTMLRATITMDLRIPMFRPVVEKLISTEVRKIFDAESEALTDLATLA